MGEPQGPEYDSPRTGTIDPAKWKILSLPLGNGQSWDHAEPAAQIVPRDQGLSLTVNPFTRKHDHIAILDNPKHFYPSIELFELASNGATIFEAEMAD
jgi:hypothetical protein